MADDTVPLKKTKTSNNRNKMVAEPSDRSYDVDDKGKLGLDKSGLSRQSQRLMDRSSVKSSLKRGGPQTVEEYIAVQFGMQFTELVFLLSEEQQAEASLDETRSYTTSA